MQMAYGKAPYYKKYIDFLEYVYLEKEWEYLHDLNCYLIEYISRNFLGIQTVFSNSRIYKTHGVKHEKLLSLLKAANTDVYVSGPAAKDYIIAKDYEEAGIDLIWKDYSNYPKYPQKSNKFTHFVSIWDLLFNVGDDAPYYIWGWREDSKVG